MITEIEIEGLGIMRHLNEWQQERWFKMARGPNRVIAPAAFGLGMSLQQFKRLPVAQQKAALQAYDCLTSPGNFDAPRNAPEVRNPFPRAGSHVPNQKQVELGGYSSQRRMNWSTGISVRGWQRLAYHTGKRRGGCRRLVLTLGNSVVAGCSPRRPNWTKPDMRLRKQDHGLGPFDHNGQ